jgi:hypothetical protein
MHYEENNQNQKSYHDSFIRHCYLLITTFSELRMVSCEQTGESWGIYTRNPAYIIFICTSIFTVYVCVFNICINK